SPGSFKIKLRSAADEANDSPNVAARGQPGLGAGVAHDEPGNRVTHRPRNTRETSHSASAPPNANRNAPTCRSLGPGDLFPRAASPPGLCLAIGATDPLAQA